MSKAFDFPLLFQALADKTRLRLLNLIGEDEICVCFLVEALKTNQPKISRHLSYLRKAGIVAARRDGKWMHYRVIEPADPSAAKILADTRAWLAADGEMQRDRERLVGILVGDVHRIVSVDRDVAAQDHAVGDARSSDDLPVVRGLGGGEGQKEKERRERSDANHGVVAQVSQVAGSSSRESRNTDGRESAQRF